MIHKISLENFFSVAERQEIDFQVPANTPDHPCFQPSRSDDNERLPLVVAIYGPNASGKSTILRAITATAWFVQHSFTIAPEQQLFLFNPYAKKTWWDRPTKIVIEFDSKLSEEAPAALFRYELHIGHDPKKWSKNVAYEALSYAPQGRFRRVFERKEQSYYFGDEFDMSPGDPRVQGIRSNASVISTLAQYNHKISRDLIRWLTALQTNIIGIDKAQGSLGPALNYYANNADYLSRLNRELNRLDLGLQEMKIIAGNPGPTALFKHVDLDCDLYIGQESSGTRRFIELFPLLQYVLDIGGIAVIDELDTDIHPLVMPEIFRWFYDKKRNIHKAQLFFTGHNTAILDDLEKEQVFFTEKTNGFTHIYGARQIKGLRREPSLMRKYLSGELGAVPHIG